jgi:hypothetical protein
MDTKYLARKDVHMDNMKIFFKCEGTKNNNQLIVSYNKSFEVILGRGIHLTSQPTQPPSVVKEQHRSQQQELAVHLSRTPHAVAVVPNIIVPQGQLPKLLLCSLSTNEGTTRYFVFI